MGLEELTTYKWVGYGNGQVRSYECAAKSGLLFGK